MADLIPQGVALLQQDLDLGDARRLRRPGLQAADFLGQAQALLLQGSVGLSVVPQLRVFVSDD